MAEPFNRRRFLKTAGAAGVVSIVSTLGSGSLPISAWATPGSNNDTVLVSISLRGAADGLNIVCPHGDNDYYRQRGQFGLQPGQFTDIDGLFGLNNDFGDLQTLFDQKQMTVVQAVGMPLPERSHFEAQAVMDSGIGSTGWLQRAISESAFASTRAGLTIGDRTDPQLSGPFSGGVISTADEVTEAGDDLAQIRPAIEELYGSPQVAPLEREAVLDAFATIDEITDLDSFGGFPHSTEGGSLREAARLITADFGVRAIAVNATGWDHHSRSDSRLKTRGKALAGALEAFARLLGPDWKRVIVVVSSEFGRQVQPNGAGGTDHGWGNLMLVLGDRLSQRGGGSVLTPGGWPGLATNDLFEGRDLVPTTDFRSVYAELIDRHLGVSNIDAVFPGLGKRSVGLLPETQFGDIDNSGSVTNADVQSLLDANVRGQTPPGGDIDGDGDIDLRDALVLSQQLDG